MFSQLSQFVNCEENDDLNYDSLLSNFIQFNLNYNSSTYSQQQNVDNILNTCQNLCKSLKLNKNFQEFLKKFNTFAQNLDRYEEFSFLKEQNESNLVENVECLFKFYNCSTCIINHLICSHENLIATCLHHVISFVLNLLSTIKTIYSFINNYTKKQNLSASSTQSITISTQYTLTQIVRDSFNNNSTLQSSVKLQNELIVELCKLIDLISPQINNSSEAKSLKNEIIKLSDYLIAIIKSIKNDAKLTIALWKCLYTFLKKNRKTLDSSINLNDCLSALNDEISVSLNYLKTNNTESSDIASLGKIIKICILLLKLFKSILEAYALNASNVNDNLINLVKNLIIDLTYTSHAGLVLKEIQQELMCEVKPIINFLTQFLYSNYQLDFTNCIIKCDKNDRIVIFLLNFLHSTHLKDLSIITKLFEMLNYSSIDIYLPNVYLFSDENAQYEVEFSLYVQICLSSHVKHTVNSNDINLILNLVNFFLYNHLYGTHTQAQYSNDCLIYLNKIVGNDFKSNLNTYYLNIYENTQNLMLKHLIISNIQHSPHIYEYVIKRPSMINCQSLLFSNLVNTPQLRQAHQAYLTKYILNTQNQFIDCLNKILNEQSSFSTEVINKFLVTIKYTQVILEFCPQFMQNEQKFKEIYFKLIKLLKVFNIQKLKQSFSLIIKFVSEIIFLLKLYNLNFKQLNQILDNKIILFKLNFMQQLSVLIETTSSISLNNCGSYLKILKFYSIDYIQSLAKISSFDNFEKNSISSECLDDNDQKQVDNEGRLVSSEKMIVNKLVTFFCYLLNDSNCLIIQLTLECLDDFRKHSKYFDCLLPEIIRSNKLKMQELIGNYLRKIPKKCSSNDYEILSSRLNNNENENLGDEDENIELVSKFEQDAVQIAELYAKLNKPIWFRSKIESIIKILNE